MLVLAYSVAAYAAFLAVVGALVDFTANAGFWRSIDAPPSMLPLPLALAVDVGLVALFGASHSIMARGAFKARWTKIVPPPAERSTYVLVASLSLALLVRLWQAVPVVLWDVGSPGLRAAIWLLSAAGLLTLVTSTFLTDHFDLFGLRQGWLHLRGAPYTPTPFVERGLYKLVRHPMMLGLLVAFWAAPTMTVGHLVFVVGMSAYVFIGVALEERDLARHLGEAYRAYGRRVGRFFPKLS